jgi:HTH-type transcriptional regulator/antitoxin HigA
MTIHAIRTDADMYAAIKRIEVFMGCDAGSSESDELEVLATLVAAYEKQHYPMPASDPISAIEFAMDQQGWTRRDLEPLIGTRGRVSEVLSGKRPLTLAMIRKLCSALKIPADILIQVDARRSSRKTANRRSRSVTPSRPARVPTRAQKTARPAAPARPRSRAA